MAQVHNPAAARAVILNVDDTEPIRYSTTRIMEHAGFTVWQAASGKEALLQVARQPDLVLLDVRLPDISGFEVCRRIKSDPHTSDIPVLHQSAIYVDAHARASGLDSGADAYLVHPIEPGELLSTIRALLRLKQVETQARESDARYRLIFEFSPLPCLLFDAQTLRVVEVNSAAVRTYGYSRDEFLTLTLNDLRLPEQIPSLLGALQKRDFDQPFSTRHRRRDGHLIDVEGAWRPLQVDGRECVLEMIHDVTERNRAAERAAAEHVRRELLRHVLQAQEEERRRISRELHDEAGQLLASLLVGLRAISGAKKLAEARRYASDMRAITHHAMDEISKLARGLHPTALDDLGLTAALERHIQEFERTHNLRVTLRADHVQQDRLSPEVQSGLFRIVQEALTNVARHAQARHVSVSFRSAPHAIKVVVLDDGRGLAVPWKEYRSNGHLGLQSMRERAELLGGRFDVISGPKGTAVVAWIPLQPSGAARQAS